MQVFNFCAGPAFIADSVLKRAQAELLNWRGMGTSVMCISHRSGDFMDHILLPAQFHLKKLLNIPDNYKILFISTGTSHQFSMVPLNLLPPDKTADYVHTGIWSGKAIQEAKRYGKINTAWSSEKNGFTDIADLSDWHLTPNAAYLHYTPNETVHGLEFPKPPEISPDVPLVADMSSTILSRPIDIEKFGVIYAGAQKNIGPAGLTIVIVREDLLGHARPETPYFYNYKHYADENSLCNTPATFAIYLAGLVFEWILEQGGLEKMAEKNFHKASKLYQQIDHSGFYTNKINPAYRSWMNVIFNLASPELDRLFAAEAQKAGLLYLRGHKALGGIRASIYNSMPEEGVDALIAFMQDFERQYG